MSCVDSCSSRTCVLAWSFTLVALGGPCVFTQAASPGQSSSPLRYRWQAGQVFAYEVEITADRNQYVDTMKGVISYTVKAAEGDQLKVAYRGGLKRTKKTKAGQSSGAVRPPFGPRFGRRGFPGGPRGPFDSTPFQGLTTTSNTITLTSQGIIQSLEGDSQLPYLLGNLSLMAFEPLPEDAQSSWSVGSGVTITEEKGRRTGPPHFARPPRGPWGPFGREGPDKRTAGSETVALSIQNDDGRLVTADKRYQLSSPATDGESFEITGSGTWVFNRELAVSESLDFNQQLIVQDGGTKVTVPVTVKYRRLSESELAEHRAQQQKQQEELKQRLAEIQEKRAAKPVTAQDESRILENLKSNNTAVKLRALRTLQNKTSYRPTREIAAAVRALLDSDNQMVRKAAAKTAANWPESAAAGAGAGGWSSEQSAESTQAVRTWTDDTGQFKIEAEFLGLTDGNVRLRRTDGREISVPLARLSPADQQAARELSKRAGAASNPFDP